MAEPQIDDLYRRYAATGDLKALAAVFDALAPDLLRLARRLLRDRARAEDLVQETFLTALESPESYDPELALQPWLIGILVNRARTERRRAGRELDVERLRGGEEPEPVEALVADESRSLIERAIAELPPRLRAVVEGKVLQGRDSLDLAAELDLSHGALRARLHRGLRRLRRALPASLATGLALWFTPSRGLAQVRARVLEEAAKAPAGAAGMGGLLMSKKVVWSSLAVIVAVIGGGLWGAGLLGGERNEASSRTDLEPPDPREQLADAPEPPEPTRRAELTADTVIDEAGLVVRVLGESDGAAVEGVEVRLSYEFDGEEAERTVVTHAEGEAHFEFEETVKLRVVHVDPGVTTTPARSFLRRPLESGERQELELFVNRGGTLAGRVVDLDGLPVPGAEVLGWHRYWKEPCRRTRSDADGAFTLEHLGSSFYATARTPKLACCVGLRGDLAAGARAEGLEIRLAPAESMRGVVLAPDGTPIQGARLRISHGLNGFSDRDLTEVPGILSFIAGQGEAVSDETGRFEITDLPQGRHGVSATRAPYLVGGESHSTGELPVEIVLDPGLQLAGRVFDAHGRPAEGARVRFWPCWGNVHMVDCWQVCDESGHFLLPSLIPEEETTIAVLYEGHAVAVVHPVEPGPGGGEFVELQLDPEARIAGRVVDAGGLPVSGARVWVEGDREMDPGYRTDRRNTWERCTEIDTETTGEDGSFGFGNLYRGPFTVHVHSSENDEMSIEHEVQSPTLGLELVLDPVAMRKVVLRGTVTDAITGKALQRFEILPREGTLAYPRSFTDDDGRYEVAGLSPGTIGVEARAEGYAHRTVEPRHFDVGEHRVDLALYPTRSLILSVTDSAGDPHARGEVEALGADGRPCLVDTAGGRGRDVSIRNGRAALHGLPAQPLVLRVTVEETVLEVDVDLTHPLEGELEVVIDLTLPVKASFGALTTPVFVVAPEIEAAELQRRLRDAKVPENRDWLSEHMLSGAIAWAEGRIEADVLDTEGTRLGSVVLTPQEDGTYHEETRTWFRDQQTFSESDPPSPAFNLHLPAIPLLLRARTEKYGEVEVPLELAPGETRVQALVLRP